MEDGSTLQNPAESVGNTSCGSLTRDELLALIPQGSRVEYATADKSICVVHAANGEVVAILSDKSAGPVARRARLIACIPSLLSGCSDDTLAEIAACVGGEPDCSSPLWGYAKQGAPPTKP